MKALFVHQGFPGQFKHLIHELRARGDEVAAISNCSEKLTSTGIKHFPYKLKRGNGQGTHPLAIETETKVIRGEAVASIANRMKKSGYSPDIIIAHPGWGESLFLADIWPEVPQLHYVEFAYRAKGTDNDFIDRFTAQQTWHEKARGYMKNANVLLNLQSMTWGISPTYFQRSTLPDWGRAKTSVIHDGIDTGWASPDSSSKLRLSNGRELNKSDELITFVNRTFEPYRGIHILLDALPKVLKARPKAEVLLVGKDTAKVSYGAHRDDGRGWLTALRDELGTSIDWTRVHTLGKVPHDQLRQIFRISSVHVYLTYPFVLSWSMLEAMSCEALIIGSSTAPVREVIRHGFNGLLVPFTDTDMLSEQLIKVLDNPQSFIPLRKRARETIIKRYNLRDCLRKQLALIDALANKAIVA